MPRTYARKPTRPDAKSEQTHDDCEWLDEEDGEEDVSSDWRAMDRRFSSPAVGQQERRNDRRKNNADAERCSGNRWDSRWVRRLRLMAFGGGAAGIGLSLGDNALRGGVRRFALVHRAIAVRAARHARLWGCRPAST